MEEFKSMIKHYRENLGLTQRQLADIVGIDVSTLRNWESGRTGLDLIYKVAKLCNALDCFPDDLVAIETDTPLEQDSRGVSQE